MLFDFTINMQTLLNEVIKEDDVFQNSYDLPIDVFIRSSSSQHNREGKTKTVQSGLGYL